MLFKKHLITGATLAAALLGTTACTTSGMPAFTGNNAQIVYLEGQPYLLAPDGNLHALGDATRPSFDAPQGNGYTPPKILAEPYTLPAKDADNEKAQNPDQVQLVAAKRAAPETGQEALQASGAIAALANQDGAKDAGPQRRLLVTDKLLGGDSADDLPASEIIEAANRSARKSAERDGFINATQVFNYEPGVLYQLYTAPRRLTTIILEPGEQVTAKAAGDTVRWMLAETVQGSGENKRTVLLLKPLRADISTNILIATNRRTYTLEAYSNEGDAYMANVSWNYPLAQIEEIQRNVSIAQDAEKNTVESLAPGVSPMDLDYAYRVRTVEGGGIFRRDPSWKPTRVFDDGGKVYIQFPDAINNTDAPALFVQRGGESAIVNYRVKGNYYVVDRLFDAAELRVGQDNATVVRIEKS